MGRNKKEPTSPLCFRVNEGKKKKLSKADKRNLHKKVNAYLNSLK